ncbi:prolyl oligopeptidase family serine peptidase [Aliidiomarina sedimenti]|nr:prolyl oligopeptidase family serine peptidase [Aliidiomarina sedimenti]
MNKLLFSMVTIMTVSAALTACTTTEQAPSEHADEELNYPVSPRSDQVTDYHGNSVQDPYRWLEDLNSQTTQQWVTAQNRVTLPYLADLEQRDALKTRLTQVWNYERSSTPFRHGRFYFHFQNNGLQDQSVLYVREGLNGAPRPLLDPNQLSDDGTVSLTRVMVSPNAQYLAYAISDGGSDWVEFRVRDIQSGEDLADRLTGIKFSNVSWLPDGSGFYYSRYPETPAGEVDDSRSVAIYFHRIGSAQRNDRRIYDLSQYPSWNPYPEVTRDGRFLIATITDGFSSNAVHILDLTNRDARWRRIIDYWDGLYEFIDSDANLLFFRTTAGAENGRVIAVDVNRPQPQHWQELIAERDATLREVRYVGGKFFAHYLEDAHSQIEIFNAYGRHEDSIELPGIGSVDSITGQASHLETFFTYTSFTEPGVTLRYDIDQQQVEEIDRAQSPADLSNYQTRQVWYESDDGTAVSMFIVHRHDIELDSANPALLYGYGGFNVALTPSYNPAHTVWLEQGGVLAIPNLRGGGEYGANWHQAGTKLNKQNVFDDFISAARYLIDEGYTSPQQLAIQGASNGGLLVGAVMTQQPSLFAAALPDVGVLDMLRYHTSSANAKAWSSDYGLATDAEDFAALLAYSPVHNVETGVCYPATLITTGDHDDRVAPWHSYKFAAALQNAQSCDNPVLLRVETRAGHGAGTPTWMRIDQVSDQWAFLLDKLQSESQSSNLNAD